MDRTNAERQRRYIAKLKAAAAAQLQTPQLIGRILDAASAARFPIKHIEFSANGSIIVVPAKSEPAGH
jgi:hypothetical protein